MENYMTKENQIDLIYQGLGQGSMFAGYDNMKQLRDYVNAATRGDAADAELVIAMVAATCKNLINEKLEGQH